MNITKHMQTDSKWGSLPYPRGKWQLHNCGCGCASIANVMVELEKYANYTPATIQPYCKQYADANGNGTYWSGIPKMLKHYGFTEVKEHATMNQLWAELAKGDRIAILLMGSAKAGGNKQKWTSGGHFICATDYRYRDGKHYLYIKDSYSNASNRNGWLSYEWNLKNAVLAVWSGKISDKKYTKPAAITTKTTTKTVTVKNPNRLAVDGVGGKKTVQAMQKYFQTVQDGVISGQTKNQAQFYPALHAVEFGKGGSLLVKALQRWIGVTRDGVIGKGTTCAWQKKLRDLGYLAKNERIDGYFGVKSMKAMQNFLNDKLYPDTKKTVTETKITANTTTTAATAKPAATTTAKTAEKTVWDVIDVSSWQGTIDWAKAKKAGIDGAIIRYADGDLLDSKFERNMTEAKKAGLHVGCYIYSRAMTSKEAADEAHRIYAAAKKYSPDMPIYIDLEAKGQERVAAGVGAVFINTIESLGGRAGVYANLNWFNNYLQELISKYSDRPLWLAQYNDKITHKNPQLFGMWQYTSSGSVPGISGRVDMNKCYKKYWK